MLYMFGVVLLERLWFYFASC